MRSFTAVTRQLPNAFSILSFTNKAHVLKAYTVFSLTVRHMMSLYLEHQ